MMSYVRNTGKKALTAHIGADREAYGLTIPAYSKNTKAAND